MEGGERKVHLLCPSLSKAHQLVAGDDQKLDLGSIARAFGLDPNTLKLNGYFISRGADLIASSVTWHSLIAFFSARAFPTGASSSAPILVHGKTSSKRSRNEEDAANTMDSSREVGFSRDSKRPQHQHCSRNIGLPESDGLCTKRKWQLEDESRLKRARLDEARFSCSIINKNLKRMRIDEIVAASPSKKLR